MKLVAVNAKTGKPILKHDGNLDDKMFRQMVANIAPLAEDEDILIFRDGVLTSADQKPRGKNKTQSHKKVIWKGSFTDLGGYANMNREIATRLLQHGFSVKVDPLRTRVEIDSVTHGTLLAMQAARMPDEANATMVIGFTPMPIQPRRGRTVFYTMMETQGLHREFVQRCNDFSTEVWVPCEFYRKVFKDHGVVKDVKTIPLGVNQYIYTPDAIRPIVTYDDILGNRKTQKIPQSFKYMSLFGWSHRKGPDVLCRSFIREFTAKDDVALCIFSRYMGSSADTQKQHVIREILSYYEEEKKEDPPPIYYCGDEIPINDLPGCYCSCNAFVFCSRGEGFGLPVVEAGACGLPVISGYNTSMTEYLDDEVAWLVRPKMFGPANDKLTWISEYYRNQDFVIYTEDDIVEFGTHMRTVLNDDSAARKRADAFRAKILEKYTWDACVRRVSEELTR